MKIFRPISESQLQASLQADKDNEYKASVSSAINDESLERIACDTAIVNSLAAETLNRTNADNALQAAFTDDINAEKSLRTTADAALQSSIAAERTARINADTSLTDDFNAKLQTESTDRAAQFKTVGDALNAEVNQRQNAVVTLTSAIDQIQTQINNDATVKSALENEISARTGESASINSAIDGLRSLHNLDKAELQTTINTEKSARQSDVSVLQSSIGAVDSGYKAADVTLKSYVDGEISNLKSSDTAVWTALSNEVTLRNSQTSSLASALNAESVQRAGNFNSASNSISAISNALNAEIANRQNKDSQLQSSLETAVTNFNAAYKVFGGSTTEHAGTAGIVPPPPILEDSDTVYYLTNRGWGEPIEVDIKIGKIPSQAGTLTFNGQTQTPDWNDYDPLALEISGATSGSDAATYTVYFQPRDGYKWTNGTRDKMSATYTINAYVVTIPTAATTSFEYTGNSITLNVVNFDSTGSSQTGVTSATNKGDYTARYELKNTKNYIFSDNTTAAKTISWHITVKSIDKPTISNVSFDYDGNNHAPTVTGFNAAWMTKTGTESSINAGNFTITVALADKTNTQWSTGGTADVTLNWVVNRKKLTAAQSTGFEQSRDIYCTFDSYWLCTSDDTHASWNNRLAISNTLSGYHSFSRSTVGDDAGSYAVSISPTNNYCWYDGSTTPVNIQVVIKKAKIKKPSASQTTFYYTGSTIDVLPDYTVSVFIDMSGDKTAINVDNYSVKFTIPETKKWNGITHNVKTNIEWEDGTTDDVVLNWSIVKGNGFAKPTLSANSFEWTGGNISPTINNFDSNTMTKSGSDTAVALGTYSITVALKDKVNTSWADGSTNDITLTYTITKRTLPKPTLATSSYTYDGAAKTPAVNNFNSTYMEKTSTSVSTATNAGNYSIVVNLKDTSNCQWAGGGNGSVTLNWIINRKLLTAAQSTFSQSGNLIYSGSSQTVTISGYSSTYHDLSSETSAVNAGSYVAKVTPKANYAFSDGSYSAKTVNWVINKSTLEQLSLTNTTFTYDGNNHSPTISNYFPKYENMTGVTDTATAGTYTVTVTLKDSNNFQLNGTTATSVSKTWTINKAKLTKPSLSNTTYTYDGNNHSPTINNFDSTLENISGTTNTSTANTYTVTFSLKNSTNYMWADSSTANVQATWVINKATPTLTLDTTSVTLDNDNPTATISYTYTGDGTVQAVSQDTETCDALAYTNSASINTMAVGFNTTTIKVTATAGTNYNAITAAKTISVTSNYVRAFNACKDWNEIKRCVDSGKAKNYWSVGDYRTFSRPGVMSLPTNITGYRVTILGFNHNKYYDNWGKSHTNYCDFLITDSDGKALHDAAYHNQEKSTNSYFGMTKSDYSGSKCDAYPRGCW